MRVLTLAVGIILAVVFIRLEWQVIAGLSVETARLKEVAERAADMVGDNLPALGYARIEARVRGLYDGDTIYVAYDDPRLGRESNQSIRIKRIDTPEIRGKCEAERRAALAAKQALAELLTPIVYLARVEQDKYPSRKDADVYLSDGRLVADVMMEQGHGVRYSGGRRRDWCLD